MKEAEQMSLHHPDIFYMVMDKIGKRAIVTGWSYVKKKYKLNVTNFLYA